MSVSGSNTCTTGIKKMLRVVAFNRLLSLLRVSVVVVVVVLLSWFPSSGVLDGTGMDSKV